jgi:excinuclease ABC subunit C
MTDDQRIERLRDTISRFPKTPGVYLMKDGSGRVLYVGKAKDLRSRVSSYFQDSADLLNTRGPEIARMASMVTDIDFLDCETEVDALLSEARLIKDIQPQFNAQLKDDKTFPYVEITIRDDFPGVYVTRTPRPKGTKLYGPFTNAFGVRQAINALQRVFRFRTCELEIQADDESRRFFRPCLLHAIKQCTAPCADLIGKDAYRKDIDRLKKFLASKRSVVLRQMKKEMEAAAVDQRFEEAAELRDRIKAIESLSLAGTPDEHVQPEVFFIDPTAGLEKLGELLDMDQPPRSIEGIDIANLQGDESVGALVCFLDGRPFKNGYRRFRIKTIEGIDDYDPDRRRPGPVARRAGGLRRDEPTPADGHLLGQARRGDLHPGQIEAGPPAPEQRSPAPSATGPRRGPPLRPTLPPHTAPQKNLRRRQSRPTTTWKPWINSDRRG